MTNGKNMIEKFIKRISKWKEWYNHTSKPVETCSLSGIARFREWLAANYPNEFHHYLARIEKYNQDADIDTLLDWLKDNHSVILLEYYQVLVAERKDQEMAMDYQDDYADHMWVWGQGEWD
jgi:hypothetical protein